MTTSPPKPITLKTAPPPLLVPVADENDDSSVLAYMSQFLLYTFEVVNANEELLIGTSSQISTSL